MMTVLACSSAWAATKSIGTDMANARTGPGHDYTVILRLPLGYPIQIECEKGEWLRLIDWHGDKGWIHRPFVSDVKTVIVSVRNANIHSAPVAFGEVVKTALRGDIYRVLEKKSKWVRIGHYPDGNHVGWIWRDQVFGE
jgi:SH3-like domain-containing protein